MVSMAAAVAPISGSASPTRCGCCSRRAPSPGACAGNIAAAQAYIADVTPPEKRASGMGMIGAAFGLGFIIGPALGGVVAGNDPGDRRSATPGLIAAGLSRVAFVGVARCCCRRACRRGARRARRPRPHRASLRERLRPAGAAPAASLVFFLGDPRLRRHGDHLCAVGDARNSAGAGAGRVCLLLCRHAVGGDAGRADRAADAALRRGAADARRARR